MKKALFAQLVVFLLMSAFALSEEVFQEETYIPKTECGVIARGPGDAQALALIDELEVVYFTADKPYLTKGTPVKFTVHASGGDGKYSYTFGVYWRASEGGSLTRLVTSKKISNNYYSYTPTKDSGQYIILVRVTDSEGYYIEWQSQVFESSTSAAAQKALSLAEECKKIADTDYARALVLHDWIINNADYDDYEQYAYASGVLLNGRGLCQSYALAYEMLLKLCGIDCIYVTGWAGIKSHAWNLAKIDGNWYHIDCTWDDPAPGQENHNYFCVTDEMIGRDHYWNLDWTIMPKSVGADRSYQVRAGAKTCKSIQDIIDILNDSLKNKRAYTEIWYEGEKSYFDFEEAVDAWYDQAQFPSDFIRYRYEKDVLGVKVEMDFGNGYPDLSKPQSIALEMKQSDISAGDELHPVMLVLPTGADTSGIVLSSSDETVIRAENGSLKAVNPGVCLITARGANGASAEMTLYVNSDIEIRMPSSMTMVKKSAFAGCIYLETIILPDGVLEIGDNAFLNCTLLKTVSIPDSVSKIGKNAFSGCDRVVIECAEGSYAHEYAQAERIEYRLVSK